MKSEHTVVQYSSRDSHGILIKGYSLRHESVVKMQLSEYKKYTYKINLISLLLPLKKLLK